MLELGTKKKYYKEQRVTSSTTTTSMVIGTVCFHGTADQGHKV